MAVTRSMQSRKAWRLLYLIGLQIILLSLVFFLMIRKNKDGWYNRSIIRKSRYASLERFIIAQAKHETGNFKSKAYKKNANMFGMKNANKRKQIGWKGNPYRNYLTDGDSLRDLFLYFDYVGFPTSISSVEQFSRELKDRSYYEDSFENYSNGLKRFL